MADGRDVRALSIGDAVRFTHRGKTIHGHLLRRQRRRTLATVIDDADRLWKVPEAALTPSGLPRRATMVTGDDTARAQWRVGDRVAFAGPDGTPRSGKIVKLNPTQARVRVGRTLWNVPYGGLSGMGGPGRQKKARNGAERLANIAAMARELMDEHGLGEWTFAFLEAERRLGDCHFQDRVIRIGRPMLWTPARPRSGTPSCTRSPTPSPAPRPATAPSGRPPQGASAPPPAPTSTNAAGGDDREQPATP